MAIRPDLTRQTLERAIGLPESGWPFTLAMIQAEDAAFRLEKARG